MSNEQYKQEEIVRNFMHTTDTNGETDFFQLFGAYFERFNSEGERSYTKPRNVVRSAFHDAYVSLFRHGKTSITVDLSTAGVNGKPVSPRYAQDLVIRWERASGFYTKVKVVDNMAVLHRGMRLVERVQSLHIKTFGDIEAELHQKQGEQRRKLDQKLLATPQNARRQVLEEIENFKTQCEAELEALKTEKLPANGQFFVPTAGERARLADSQSLFPIHLLLEGEVARFGPFASVPNNEAGVPNYFEHRLMQRIATLSKFDSKEYKRNHRMPGEFRVWTDQCLTRKDSALDRVRGYPSAPYLYVECVTPVRFGFDMGQPQRHSEVAQHSDFKDTREVREAVGVPSVFINRDFEDLPVIFRKKIEEWNNGH